MNSITKNENANSEDLNELLESNRMIRKLIKDRDDRDSEIKRLALNLAAKNEQAEEAESNLEKANKNIIQSNLGLTSARDRIRNLEAMIRSLCSKILNIPYTEQSKSRTNDGACVLCGRYNDHAVTCIQNMVASAFESVEQMKSEKDALKNKVELGAQEGIKRVFDMLTYMAANTNDRQYSETLQDLAEDILDEAADYKSQWKNICKLTSDRDIAIARAEKVEDIIEDIKTKIDSVK